MMIREYDIVDFDTLPEEYDQYYGSNSSHSGESRIQFSANVHGEFQSQLKCALDRWKKRIEQDSLSLDMAQRFYKRYFKRVIRRMSEFKRNERNDDLKRMLPVEFCKEVDVNLLMDPCAFNRVLKWSENASEHMEEGQGLVCCGKTGAGKTRAVYKLLSNLYVSDNISFKAISSLDFADKVRTLSLKSYSDEYVNPFCRSIHDEPQTLEEFADRLKRIKILFIDDLHHAKFTPRYAQELFRLIDYRVHQHKPIFITSQVDGERLLKKLAGDNTEYRETAEAIIRRIRDFCVPIHFN